MKDPYSKRIDAILNTLVPSLAYRSSANLTHKWCELQRYEVMVEDFLKKCEYPEEEKIWAVFKNAYWQIIDTVLGRIIPIIPCSEVGPIKQEEVLAKWERRLSGWAEECSYPLENIDEQIIKALYHFIEVDLERATILVLRDDADPLLTEKILIGWRRQIEEWAAICSFPEKEIKECFGEISCHALGMTMEEQELLGGFC